MRRFNWIPFVLAFVTWAFIVRSLVVATLGITFPMTLIASIVYFVAFYWIWEKISDNIKK